MNSLTPHFGERRTLVVDGQRICVFESGSGEPCFLLHGYPQSHWCWRGIAQRLSLSHRVIAPDWFGWGESERSLASRPSYKREVARIALLLDAIKAARVNLICHDYGGFLGLGFALLHPKRVMRLAVINSRAQGDFAPASYLLFNLLSGLARLPFGEALFAAIPHYSIHRHSLFRFVRNGSFPEEDLERYISFLKTDEGRRWLGHYYRYFQPTRRRELRKGAARLTMPAAVIWGDRDPYSPLRIGQELARLLPDATFTRLPGADHFSPEERPQEIAAALLVLLAKPVG